VVRGRPWTAIRQAVLLAILAVVLGSFSATVVGTLADLPGSNVDWRVLLLLPYLIAIPIVGIVLFGLHAFAVTLPAALLWMATLRVLAPRLQPTPPPLGPAAP
jgi:hypothetical protein